MQSTYNVPVIPQNLRKEETIINIATSLNYLSQVSDDVIKRINDRIELNSKQLSKLSNRINTVSLKINKLKGGKKAIQVFSSSRYPAADVNRKYKSVFSAKDCPKLCRYTTKYTDLPIKDEAVETLQFYHVKVSDVSRNKSDGLGDIPKDIGAVNDLLLYSSGKNPYNKYVMSDTLQMQQTLKREDVSELPEIEAAPLSISERTTLIKTTGNNYFYSPNLGDVPTIDVPLDLPDLPGIADDLRYVDESEQGIAPSVTTTPNIPDLPEIFSGNETKIIPPIVHNTNETINEQITIIPNEKVEAVPEEPKQNTNEVFEERNKKPIVDNAHANLMEAIRKAGGSKKANLKSAETEKVEKSSTGGGDLMADLHAKLTLRRKGISGAKNLEPGTAAMDKISAMIPPPPNQVEEPESVMTDDDWDD